MTKAAVSTLDEQLCWYAIYTNPRQEERVESNLRAWHVETYLPKIAARSRHPSGSHSSRVVKPLFSRYIFARFIAKDLLHKVHFTRGVQGVVGFGEWPTPVDDEIITLLKNQSDDNGYIRIGQKFKAGDRVKIMSGPLRNFVGIFEGDVSERDCVAILLTAVSFQSHAVVDRETVEKLPEIRSRNLLVRRR
jgi:transcriptional antiterminator RfaH